MYTLFNSIIINIIFLYSKLKRESYYRRVVKLFKKYGKLDNIFITQTENSITIHNSNRKTSLTIEKAVSEDKRLILRTKELVNYDSTIFCKVVKEREFCM